MSNFILVSVTNLNDVNLASSVFDVLNENYSLVFLFENEVVLEKFFDIGHPKDEVLYSTDFSYILLHFWNFLGVITFSAPLNCAQIRNLKLVSFMKKQGVPVVEIQHGLFQYGYNYLDSSPRIGFDFPKSGWGLPTMSSCDHFLSWSNIGYPKTNMVLKEYASKTLGIGSDFNLIVTNTNWHIYSEEEVFKLINFISNVIRNNPGRNFVWKPHPAEYSKNPELYGALKVFNFKNLRIIELHESQRFRLEDILGLSRCVISTVSTSVLDCVFLKKPTIIYACDAVESMVSILKFPCFSDFNSLQVFIDNPHGHSLPDSIMNISRFNEKVFIRCIKEIFLEKPVDRRDSIPYLEFELGNRNNTAEVDECEELYRKVADRIDSNFKDIKKRIDIVQRSTISYKIKKLISRFKR